MLTNARALTRILLMERPSLLRLAERIVRDKPMAEDVTQSLWLKVQGIDDDPPIANRRAYLFRLATNMAIDRLKAMRRQNALFVPDDFAEQVADDMPCRRRCCSTGRRWTRSVARSRNSPRCREVLHLRRAEGLTSVEIAQRLGISRQMVTRYIAQAVEHCLNRLDGEVGS
jgi:RNA polymerase sigma-70 factor (ECF subfamily)